MDPQQRLVLEVAWQAIENAGVLREHLEGSDTGVFVGVFFDDFQSLFSGPPPRACTGIATSLIANRVSYQFDLHGPSISLDTACSSSLVAVDLACQSLRARSSRLALAGGVNIILRPECTESFWNAGMMASDGRCKVFDQSADGYVRGEGCGIIVLKLLSEAIEDGDSILAVIRASAVNHGGRSSTLTAPNSESQQTVLRSALRLAGLKPEQVSYVEAHGTGTILGDVTELETITKVYGEGRNENKPCYIGSVKAHLGHLEAAAGIAGLIKTILCFKRGLIPGNLNFRQLPEGVTLDEKQFCLPGVLTEWKTTSSPRYAAVSSFGYGGTNAHVVLEEWCRPDTQSSPPVPRLEALLISAKHPDSLRQLIKRYWQYLSYSKLVSLQDICYSARVGRTSYRYRLALCSTSIEELRSQLNSVLQGDNLEVSDSDYPCNVSFVFSSLAGWPAELGSDLYASVNDFCSAVDECDRIIAKHGDALTVPRFNSFFEKLDTRALVIRRFVFQYALASLWKKLGIVPNSVQWCGSGELAARSFQEELSVNDAVKMLANGEATHSSLRSGSANSANNEEYCKKPASDSMEIRLELGPSETIVRHKAASDSGVVSITSLQPNELERDSLVRAMALLWMKGKAINWEVLDSTRQRRVQLPSYPFRQQLCWPDVDEM
jgi:acyl transferase domain-containing protein